VKSESVVEAELEKDDAQTFKVIGKIDLDAIKKPKSKDKKEDKKSAQQNPVAQQKKEVKQTSPTQQKVQEKEKIKENKETLEECLAFLKLVKTNKIKAITSSFVIAEFVWTLICRSSTSVSLTSSLGMDVIAD
jgi:hypothetical protein